MARGLLAIDPVALAAEITGALASQREVAARAGIPHSTLSRILNCHTQPLPSTVREIVKAIVVCRQAAELKPLSADEILARITTPTSLEKDMPVDADSLDVVVERGARGLGTGFVRARAEGIE